MNAVSSHPEEEVDRLEQLRKEVRGLYPQLGEIQFFCDARKNVSFWIVNSHIAVEEGIFSDIQQAIIGRFHTRVPGYKCNINCIMQVRGSDIISQNLIGNSYLREIYQAVESEFIRDGIRVVYENGTFFIYGAAPRDQGAVRASLIRHVSHILPFRVMFQSMKEGEESGNLTNNIWKTRRAVSDLHGQEQLSFGAGIMLSLSQIGEIIKQRLLPPN